MEDDSPFDESVASPSAIAVPDQLPRLPTSPSIDVQLPAQSSEWYWYPSGSRLGAGISRFRGERC